jgi:Rod binding domain-containing protein
MKLDNDLATYHLNQSRTRNQLHSAAKSEQEDKVAYNKSLKNACDGFEEIFVHKMLQVMRSSSEEDRLINGGRGEEIFQDMLDENYAKIITKSRAMGLSDLIYEQTKKS